MINTSVIKYTILCIFLLIVALVLFLLVRKNKKSELILLLTTIASIVIVLELFLKYFYPQVQDQNKIYEIDENLGWRFISNSTSSIAYPGEANHYIHINSDGFRDSDFIYKKNKSRKIFIVGDSFVSNLSVQDDQVFTNIIEQNLFDTAVYNLGVNGYGQVQEYLQLKLWSEKINPNLAFIFIYIRNDFNENLSTAWELPRPVINWDETYSRSSILLAKHSKPPSKLTFKRIYNRSHLWSFINIRLNVVINRLLSYANIESQRTINIPPELYLCKIENSDAIYSNLKYKSMYQLLLTINDFLISKNINPVYVLAPSLMQVDEELFVEMLSMYGKNPNDFDSAIPNHRLIEFANGNNLEMIDLLPILKQEHLNGNKTYNNIEQHWNTFGNQVVAQVLLEYIKSYDF